MRSPAGRAKPGPCSQDWRCIWLSGRSLLSAGQFQYGNYYLDVFVWQNHTSLLTQCLKSDLGLTLISLFLSVLPKASRKLEELQKHVSLRKVRYYVSPVSLKALEKEMGLMFDQTDPNPDVNEEDEVEEDLD